MTGEVKLFAGSILPAGHLWCDGSAVSRTAYAALFAAIGTSYGAGDGSTTFNVPRFNERIPMGVSAPGSGGGYNLGTTDGAAEHAIGVENLPPHSHDFYAGNVAQYIGNNWVAGGRDAPYGAITTGQTGGGLPLATLPPVLCVNFVIEA